VLAAILILAAPAAGATRPAQQRGAFAVPTPTAPIRDLVIETPSRSEARARASASAARYNVHDGAGRSVDIETSPGCSAGCTPPQTLANFLGTLPHGNEISLLTVDEVTPAVGGVGGEMLLYCGDSNALSCYFPDENRMVISGHDFTDPGDNATRDYVMAHEYGHHLANHRSNAPFANPAVDWGPKRWASFAGVCRGVASGRYVPGAEDAAHYYFNPGEAWAESYAKNAFPSLPVPWEWPAFPDPHTAGGFAAIQRDALDPWSGPTPDMRRGRFPRRRRPHRKVKQFQVPNDGNFTVTLNGTRRANLDLRLRGPDGTLIAESSTPGSREQIGVRVCGERRFTAIVRRHGRRRARFTLNAQAP
jgi:hypothetical protein